MTSILASIADRVVDLESSRTNWKRNAKTEVILRRFNLVIKLTYPYRGSFELTRRARVASGVQLCPELMSPAAKRASMGTRKNSEP